jgi:predicted kinase
MLPIIIDGTGKNFEKIKSEKDRLEKNGYDCYLVFVNAPLEVALIRNRDRERSVPEENVKEHWHSVQGNLDKFANEFGQDSFFIVSDTTDSTYLTKLAKKILSAPLNNKKGHRIKKKLREVKGSYLSDLTDIDSI